MGHARLSILDLSESGAQPMKSADGRFLGVLNGEIYNHEELRRDLSARGHVFRGTSDTESLLESFAVHGERLVPRLRGMFAFAVWDCRERRLFMARDHLGKKPFYLHLTAEGGLALASELTALAEVYRLDPAPEFLSLYFQLGYIPEPMTIYRGVETLPAASCAWWRPGGQLQVSRYWDPGAALARPRETRPDIEELDDLLRRAVGRRLMSDVPLGSFLSGGVDSALIASYLTEAVPGARTITVGFDQRQWDESPAAAHTASLLETEHIVEIVSLPDAEKMLTRYVACYDQPFADASGVPTLVLAEAARRHVKVALGGDGGDEVFCGYSRYGWFDRALRARAVLGPLAPLAANFARLVPGRGKRIAGMLIAGDAAGAYRQLVSPWHHGEIGALLAASAVDEDRWLRDNFSLPGGSPRAGAQLFDLKVGLTSGILVKVDRATMRHGLEARSPLLDVDVVEWALRSGLFGARAELGKRTLKELLSRRLPGYEFSRPKRGFALPVAVWLRGPLADRVAAAVDPVRVKSDGLFVPETVTDLWRRFREGADELHTPLWCFLAFQEWYASRR
ncbi:MAG: asparagine synthase (glutamine-hydrolyzing) [bacterium]|nr:asparagine synthase (glutamine-hydrolyzing) [bacterium]